MTKDKALRMALEALEEFGKHYDWCHQFPTYAFPENFPPCNCGYDEAITAIKEALAQPDDQLLVANILSEYGLQAIDFVADFKEAMKQVEQEPVNSAPCARHCEATAFQITIKNLEAQLAQRTWQGLTDEEKSELWEISRAALPRYATYASLVEAKLKEKNT